MSIAQEHFASRLIEGRLLALARGWNKGPGRRAVLACPPGEQHTLPLVSFGLILRSRGWRNIYLGAETPPSTVHMAADTVSADVIVMSAVNPGKDAEYEQVIAKLREALGKSTAPEAKQQLALAGEERPDVVVACVGGGSNSIGLFHPFLKDPHVKMIGVEAGGTGIESGKHAARFGGGRPGVRCSW